MPKRTIFEKKNVLVTGGAGFIGSHLCDELIETSKVICLDNFISGDERNIDHLLSEPDFEFIKHDMIEPIDLEKLPELKKFKIEFQGIQEIYHLACPTSPLNFTDKKIATILSLSYGLKNALEMAVKYKAKFMHFSSSVVYGPRRPEINTISEENIGQVDFLSDRACFDEGKRFAETMVRTFQEQFDIEAKIIRPFRTYGPRMKLLDGQMIPDFIDSALENKNLIIYGDEKFDSSFCYVSDLVDASLKMMESNISGPINIGSDVNVNLTDLAKKIIRMIGSQSIVTYADPLIFLTPLCLPDITKARNELGWLPVVTLDNGLKKTIDDLRASKGLVELKSNFIK
jgi:UDP-glucuronate decarboxylase